MALSCKVFQSCGGQLAGELEMVPFENHPPLVSWTRCERIASFFSEPARQETHGDKGASCWLATRDT